MDNSNLRKNYNGRKIMLHQIPETKTITMSVATADCQTKADLYFEGVNVGGEMRGIWKDLSNSYVAGQPVYECDLDEVETEKKKFDVVIEKINVYMGEPKVDVAYIYY
jgi:hypothetical protein